VHFVVQSAKLTFDVPVLFGLSSLDDIQTMRLAFQRNPQAPELFVGLPRMVLYSRRQIQQVT
jgi:hypothetical protein